MTQYKITHYPRDKHGNPFPDFEPIVFVTDVVVECNDKRLSPYQAFDGSVWWPVHEDEVEELIDG